MSANQADQPKERERKYRTGQTDPLVVDGPTFREHLNAWCERFDKQKKNSARRQPSGESDRYEESVQIPEVWAKEYLSIWSGVGLESIKKTLSSDAKWVTYGKADDLLTAAGLTHLWGVELHAIPNPSWTKERWQAWRVEQAGVCND